MNEISPRLTKLVNCNHVQQAKSIINTDEYQNFKCQLSKSILNNTEFSVQIDEKENPIILADTYDYFITPPKPGEVHYAGGIKSCNYTSKTLKKYQKESFRINNNVYENLKICPRDTLFARFRNELDNPIQLHGSI